MPKASYEVHILRSFNWLLRIIKFCIRSFFVIHILVTCYDNDLVICIEHFRFYVEFYSYYCIIIRIIHIIIKYSFFKIK